MKKYVSKKETNVMIDKLVKEGWTFSINKHARVTHPCGKFISFSLTPSDEMAHRQFERDVRRLKKQIEEENGR